MYKYNKMTQVLEFTRKIYNKVTELVDHLQNKTYIEYQVPFIFDSGNSSTSQITTEDGSGFTVNLEVPITLPETSTYAWVTVYGATIWYNTYNIFEGVNDKIRVSYDDGGGAVAHTLTIQAGLYDLNHLDASIRRELNGVGFPSDLFQLVPDTSTDKVVIQFNYVDVFIDFTIVDSFRVILGFNSRVVPLGGSSIAPQYEYGDTQAQFNSINYYIIHSNLVLRGQRINDTYQQAIALVDINVKPGSQISFSPDIVPRIPANELLSSRVKTIDLWLTDNNNVRVDTHNQSWSVSGVIHYMAPV